MNLEQIIARMNEIAEAVKRTSDLGELEKLEAEYTTLEKQKGVLERAQKIVSVKSNADLIKPGFIPSSGSNDQEKREDIYASVEYRTAFKNYVQKRTPIPAQFLEKRAGGDAGTTVTADVGAVIPTTIMNEFIKSVSKVYGQVYSKVRKLNIKGGVKFPISSLGATFKWITESAPSNKQKAGDIKEYVEFSYHMGEIKIATSLLVNIVTLDAFETEVVAVLVEAYVKEMDNVIINGTGSGQPLGITKDTRITNVVEFKTSEIGKWELWRKNLFAKIPLSLRGQGEFLFPASTVEAYLRTMKDTADRPLFIEATQGSIGNLGGSFFGRQITLVEPDIIKDFDTATAGDVIGIFGIFNDYVINSNMDMTYRKYFDEDTNEYIDKAIVVVDGKPLRATSFWLIKKKADA